MSRPTVSIGRAPGFWAAFFVLLVASSLLAAGVSFSSHLWHVSVAILGISALAALALSHRLHRRVYRALAEITEAVDGLVIGEPSQPIEMPTSAALGELATSLNRLVARVEAEIESLRDDKRGLGETADREMQEALRLSESRRDLVANVSHELKTPLTAIRAYAETLNDGALTKPDVAPRFVGRILEQCGRLEDLLRDLLTLSRLEHVDLGSEVVPLDLADSARRAIEALTPGARKRDIELILHVEGTPSVSAARSEVDNVLLNLIENAVKYNRQGGKVRIDIAQRGAEIILEVADTGIGIPADSVERIFERFYRVDRGRARDQGGTGLGLAIVKHAVRVLGGRIEVESRLGEGSTFRVSLPGAG